MKVRMYLDYKPDKYPVSFFYATSEPNEKQADEKRVSFEIDLPFEDEEVPASRVEIIAGNDKITGDRDEIQS